MAKKTRQRKGIWSEERLPVADRYVHPASRRRMILLGVGGCLLLALLLAALIAWRGPRAVSPGPLASAHANFEGTCVDCHGGAGSGAQAVASESCQVCHERVGDGSEGGFYSFAAHYAYRGGLDAEGIEAAHAEADETGCADCHPDHRGRDAALTRVADDSCASCHFGSFAEHPEFEILREQQADEPNLFFTHRLHVRELLRRNEWTDPQRACLACHEPEASGRGFAPLDFERHCGACHLTRGIGTPTLPIADDGDPRSPGVLTLEAVRSSGEPGTRWAFFSNPDEFRGGGGQVMKRPLHHPDPWVLANLRRIRRALYPDAGVSELLSTRVTEGTDPGGDVLLAEAVATLEAQAQDLRGTADRDVQEDLRKIDELLDLLRARIDAGHVRVPAELFAAPTETRPDLAPERVAELKRLALDLTTPCRQCHVVTDAAILRVNKDQKTLHRAEFDHRAHLVQRPFCADCHQTIPGLMDVLGEEALPEEPLDVAATHNLPTLESCRTCHTPREASDACVTCHAFHPNSRRFAALLAYRPSDESPTP